MVMVLHHMSTQELLEVLLVQQVLACSFIIIVVQALHTLWVRLSTLIQLMQLPIKPMHRNFE